MKIKKILSMALITIMVMGTTMTTFAANGSNGSNGSNGTNGTSGVICPSSSASSSVTTDSDVSVTAENILDSNAKISVAGVDVKTSIAGVYLAKTVQGCAVTTSLDDCKKLLGLTGNQKPYMVSYDTDSKKSVKAMASIQAGIDCYGGTFVTALNIDLGAMENGKFITLADGGVDMVVGLPKTCDTAKEYCMILVQRGGVVTLLEDKDVNPNTVTFEVKAGLGTYALVQK